MMLLVETSVWSFAFRRKKTATLTAEQQTLVATLTEAINDGRAVLIGPVRQEVLSGIRQEAHFDKLKSALSSFLDEVLTTADYEEAARLYNLCRAQGVECGAVDILICAVAARRTWDVLTADQDIKRALRIIGRAKPPSKDRHDSI